MFVRSLAAEWGRYGHRFNIIHPGPIRTKVLTVAAMFVYTCYCSPQMVVVLRGRLVVWTRLESSKKTWSAGFQQVDWGHLKSWQTWQPTCAATMLTGCLELWVWPSSTNQLMHSDMWESVILITNVYFRWSALMEVNLCPWLASLTSFARLVSQSIVSFRGKLFVFLSSYSSFVRWVQTSGR